MEVLQEDFDRQHAVFKAEGLLGDPFATVYDFEKPTLGRREFITIGAAGVIFGGALAAWIQKINEPIDDQPVQAPITNR